MHPLQASLRAASRSIWRQRHTQLTVFLAIWVPVQLVVAAVPAKSATQARMLLEGIAEPVWCAALLHICLAARRGRPIGVATAAARALRSLPRFIGIRTVLEFRVVAGLLAGGLPGLVMLSRYALMDVLAICEDVGPTSCRERSRALVAEYSRSVLLTIVIGMGAPTACAELADWSSEVFGNPWLAVVLQLVATLLGAALPLTMFEFYQLQKGRHPVKLVLR